VRWVRLAEFRRQPIVPRESVRAAPRHLCSKSPPPRYPAEPELSDTDKTRQAGQSVGHGVHRNARCGLRFYHHGTHRFTAAPAERNGSQRSVFPLYLGGDASSHFALPAAAGQAELLGGMVSSRGRADPTAFSPSAGAMSDQVRSPAADRINRPARGAHRARGHRL
jgi:hypothetical protein